MIGLFNPDGTRLTITIEGLELNKESQDDRFEINLVKPSTTIDFVSDPRQDTDGLEVYAPRKIGRLLVLEGVVRASSIGKLFDMLDSLTGALDPVTLADKYPDTQGFVPLDFTTPSVSGDRACRYYVRPNRIIEPIISQWQPRQEALFKIEFLLRDPRRYLQSQSSLNGTGTAANVGNFKTWPTVTFTMTGAGHATRQIANQTLSRTLVLNLSGTTNGDVIVVDMETRSIRKNGVYTPSIFVSGDYWYLDPGNNTIVGANAQNDSVVTAWRSAFAS